MIAKLRVRLSAVVPFGIALGAFGPQAMAADCLGRLRQPLAEGDYSGGLDCKDITVNIKHAGDIRVGKIKYEIYSLIYQTIPEQDEAVHGGQRVLIFKDNLKKYIGQYSLDTPPVYKVTVRNHSIYINVPKKHGNKIEITSKGLPNQAWLNQVIEGLYQ